MIHLRHDCLVFEFPTGEMIPCTAEEIALELSLEPGQTFDPEVLKNAAAAVLHYFRHELQRQEVSLKEFATALRRVLKDLGFDLKEYEMKVTSPTIPSDSNSAASDSLVPAAASVAVSSGLTTEIDLGSLEKQSGGAGELQFFQSLKADFLDRLQSNPQVIVCHGLRSCSKNLCAARRWSDRCQELIDDIVRFLRACLKDYADGRRPVLCVR